VYPKDTPFGGSSKGGSLNLGNRHRYSFGIAALVAMGYNFVHQLRRENVNAMFIPFSTPEPARLEFAGVFS
jgi:hypothetical protein